MKTKSLITSAQAVRVWCVDPSGSRVNSWGQCIYVFVLADTSVGSARHRKTFIVINEHAIYRIKESGNNKFDFDKQNHCFGSVH